jgi:hypothetical protein
LSSDIEAFFLSTSSAAEVLSSRTQKQLFFTLTVVSLYNFYELFL